jgi:glycosyltransferase involved in cell wall biosynthesis
VVSNVGAPPRIVESAGLIFERGNAEDLEKKVEAIIADNELKKKLRLGCVETVKKYDPDQIVEKIIELYKKVLAI